MKRFRVVRGVVSNSGKHTGNGLTYRAEDARAAVKQDNQAMKDIAKDDAMGGFFAPMKPQPIIAVYEMVPVPESEWK